MINFLKMVDYKRVRRAILLCALVFILSSNIQVSASDSYNYWADVVNYSFSGNPSSISPSVSVSESTSVSLSTNVVNTFTSALTLAKSSYALSFSSLKVAFGNITGSLSVPSHYYYFAANSNGTGTATLSQSGSGSLTSSAIRGMVYNIYAYLVSGSYNITSFLKMPDGTFSGSASASPNANDSLSGSASITGTDTTTGTSTTTGTLSFQNMTSKFYMVVSFSSPLEVGVYDFSYFSNKDNPVFSGYGSGVINALHSNYYNVSSSYVNILGQNINFHVELTVTRPSSTLTLILSFDPFASSFTFHPQNFNPSVLKQESALFLMVSDSVFYDSSIMDSTNEQVSSEFARYETVTDTSAQYDTLNSPGLLDFDMSVFTEVAVTMTLFSSCVTSIFTKLGNLAVPLMLFLTLALVSTILNVVGHVRAPNSSGSKRSASDSKGGDG